MRRGFGHGFRTPSARGVLVTAANLAYTFATTYALLSLSAVFASLYPLVTVALARALLHERLRPAQWDGTSAAVAGVLLVAAGS